MYNKSIKNARKTTRAWTPQKTRRHLFQPLAVEGTLVINDNQVLESIKKDWIGVELLRDKLKRSAYGSMGVVGGTFPFTLANAAHNLPFIQAYSVLNEVLIVLANEGKFKCKSIFLGNLLKSSKNDLSWNDHATIVTGVGRRNEVAHRADLLERGECWKYVDAIKSELSLWNII